MKKTGFSLSFCLERVRGDIGTVIFSVGLLLIAVMIGIGGLRDISEKQNQVTAGYLYVANIIEHNVQCSDSIINDIKENLDNINIYLKNNPGMEFDPVEVQIAGIRAGPKNACFLTEFIGDIIKDRNFIYLASMNNFGVFYNDMLSYYNSLQIVERHMGEIENMYEKTPYTLTALRGKYGELLDSIMELKLKENNIIDGLQKLGVLIKKNRIDFSGWFFNTLSFFLTIIFIVLALTMAAAIIIFFRDLFTPGCPRPGRML